MTILIFFVLGTSITQDFINLLRQDEYEESLTTINQAYLESKTEKWTLNTANNTMAAALYVTDFFDGVEIDSVARI